MRLIIFILLFPFFCLAQSQPNIIFIMSDDQGNGEFGFRDANWYTPNIDSLKRNGALINRFKVHPSCTPTRTALMTGRYPWRAGLGERVILEYDGVRQLPTTTQNLAEKLKELGYYTGIIGKWHLGHAQAEMLPISKGS